MGGFSIWHWLVLLVVLAFPLLIGVVVWLAIRAQWRRPPAAPPPPVPPTASVEQRLRVLEQLKAQGLIDTAEYARRREQILSTV
ncbi:cytoskeletal protein RodZ [Xanthomonas sacchari]|uniref:SHOCT domain-containing protein n=1 Tax=Xanthomonas sacchari TaxID=56458 RepID=UPI00277E5524|nr:SHOCT domain-containing protein [Xanthomonas sacchari]MDQ1093740.1 cytoskeletal protein RodZ [Xanthomonas sacchari]